jgi:hypothetical protein
MRMMKCRLCGFPYLLSKMIRWRDNGTISFTIMPDFRLILMESELMADTYSHIGENMGISISHLVFEAQRNAVRWAMDSLLDIFPLSLGRVGINKQLVVRIFCRLSTWLGTGYVKGLHYRPKQYGEALIRNPFNRNLMAAIVLGAFESLERRPFEHEWKIMGSDEVIRVATGDARPEFSKRLEINLQPSKDGDLAFSRCPSCDMPQDLAYLEWREEQGEIIDTRRDVRIIIIDPYSGRAVFRELEKELGEDIFPLIINAGKDYARDRILEPGGVSDNGGMITAEDREVFYRKSLRLLPLWGYGNPVSLHHEEGGLEATIENPFNKYLLAGYMAALFEAVEGVESEVTWEFAQPYSITYTARADA